MGTTRGRRLVFMTAALAAGCGNDSSGPTGRNYETGGTGGAAPFSTGGVSPTGSGGFSTGGVVVGSTGGTILMPSTGGAPTVSKCEQFKSLITSCYDGYCAGAGSSSAFCRCWTQGLDINTSSCVCITLDLNQACQVINLDNLDLSRFDCAAAGSTVGNFCRP
jgi:hypothetical protein